jgi:hypothetical protein
MSESPLPKPKIEGLGHITHRCHACGELIQPPDEPVLTHRDGRLVALHPRHEETPDGR